MFFPDYTSDGWYYLSGVEERVLKISKKMKDAILASKISRIVRLAVRHLFQPFDRGHRKRICDWFVPAS